MNAVAFSYRIHALLMRTCIEVEANFKAILEENTFTPPPNRSLNMTDYRKVDATHHLSSSTRLRFRSGMAYRQF